jgi:hypothetical protein
LAYGYIRRDDKGVAGARVSVTTDKSVDNGVADDSGSYNLSLPLGWATLSVTFTTPDGQATASTGPRAFYVYADPSKYDFDIVGTPGSYRLQAR